MKNLNKYRLLLLIFISFLSIALFSCRVGNSIRIINTTKDSLEVTFYPLDVIDSLYFIKEGYNDYNIKYVPDSTYYNLKKEECKCSNPTRYNTIEFLELENIINNSKRGFTKVIDNNEKGYRTFTLLPDSKVQIAHTFGPPLCNLHNTYCRYIGKLIIRHNNKIIVDVEKEEVGKLFKRKTMQGEEIFYLEIKQKDLEAYSKSPKTR